jgi:hypothetical protein
MRIKGCSRLPASYRSVPRPSSPLNAKASVRSPYALDRSQQNSCVPMCSRASRGSRSSAHMRFVFVRHLMSSQVRPQNAYRTGVRFEGAGLTLPSRCHLHERAELVRKPVIPDREISSFPYERRDGGARRDRTDDLMLAKHPLYQLSYGP